MWKKWTLLAVLALAAVPACSDSTTLTTADAAAPRDALDAATGPIEFINVRVEDLGAYRAVVRFDTSVPTTCEAAFGISESSLDRTATDPNMEPGTFPTTHEVPLEDLMPETTYYVVARAETEGGEAADSAVLVFTTTTGAAVDSLLNVAELSAGTTVTAVSSNYGGGANDSGYGANRALDGQMSTEWSSNGDGDGAFIEIDLGAARSLSVIGFRSRMMSDGTSIIEEFRLIVDGSTTLGPFLAPDPDIRYLFELDAPVSAQTVRLEAVMTSGGNTGIKELQLFSAP